MGQVLQGGNLALYAIVLAVVKVQFEGYNIICPGAVGPGNPRCFEDGSLATNGNFRTYHIPPIKTELDFSSLKWVDTHISFLRKHLCLRFLSTEGRGVESSISVKTKIRCSI